MAVRSVRHDATTTLFLQGAIALGTGSGSLRRHVARALEEGAERIIVDASGLSFLDAAGLGELVACRAMAEEAGTTFMLRGVSGKAKEMLRITGLDRVLLGHGGRTPRIGQQRVA